LSESQIRIQLFDANKKVATLQLGKNNPENLSTLFARRGGSSSIFTLSTNIMESLSLSTEFYRDKKLARFSSEKISQIRLYQNKILTHSVFQTNGVWFSKKGHIKREVNSSAIHSFLERLSALEVYRFVDDTSANLEFYGLFTPPLRLELEFPDQNKTMVLSFGKIEGVERFAYLEQEPFIVSVLENHIDFIRVTPWDWENLMVTRLDPKTITQFEIQRGDITSTYRRREEVWINSDGSALDSVAAETIVNWVSNLRAKKWLGTNFIANVKPNWSFRWFTPEQKELKLWNQEGRTIGFFQGEKDWFFELEAGDAFLAQQPLEKNSSANITNLVTEP